MASEIRVDKINSLSGVGTVTLSPTGVDIAGITTAATLRATTGIVTSLTAGSLTSLGAVSGTTGTFSAAVSGTTGTFSGAVSGTTGTFTGDVDIADTIVHTGDTNTKIRFPSADNISFEVAGTERLRIDDSDGVISKHTTAANLRIQNSTAASSQTATLDMAPANGVSGVQLKCTSEEDFSTGANRTAFFTVDVRKNGTFSERLRIDSSGRLMLGATDATIADSGADDFVISRAGHAGITIDSTSSTNSSIFFADGPTGTEAYRGFVQYVHSSDTLKLGASATDQLEISAGNVEITDGDLVIGTDGHGISFAATSDASGMTSELLDDYEEGTWTPQIQGTSGAGTASYNTQRGRYLKVGNLVYLTGYCGWTSGSAGGELRVTDLPFSALSNSEGIGSCMLHSIPFQSGSSPVVLYLGGGTNYTYFYQSRDNNSWISLNYDDAGYIIFNVTYRVA